MNVLKNRKGAVGAGVIGGVLLLVLGAAFLMIGLFIKAELESAIDRGGFTTAENTSWDNIVGNADTAFELMGVAMIVIGAAVIIMILRSSF